VKRISRISIVASILFLSLNWKNEKMKLNIRLRRKGSAIIKPISCCKVRINTFPKEMIIMIYSTVRAGPKTHPGGAHDGFLRFIYRLVVEYFFIYH
jgi:hypothetical protein